MDLFSICLPFFKIMCPQFVYRQHKDFFSNMKKKKNCDVKADIAYSLSRKKGEKLKKDNRMVRESPRKKLSHKHKYAGRSTIPRQQEKKFSYKCAERAPSFHATMKTEDKFSLHLHVYIIDAWTSLDLTQEINLGQCDKHTGIFVLFFKEISIKFSSHQDFPKGLSWTSYIPD